MREILFAFTAPKKETNEALYAYEQQTKKRRRHLILKKAITVSLISEQSICQSECCGTVQLVRETINRSGMKVGQEGFNKKDLDLVNHG